MQDMLIDPVTLDYVRTTNGEWEQTNDSRTIFHIALSIRIGQSPHDPNQGTAIYELLRAGDLVTPEVLQSETQRVGADLAGENVISDLVVTVRDRDGRALVAEDGRTSVVHLQWRDAVTGTPISMLFAPE